MEISLRTKRESLRSVCDTEIQIHQRKMESFASSFKKSLESIKATAEETVRNQGNLLQLKDNLRDVEDEFVKVLGDLAIFEEKIKRDSALNAEIQDAISWYNRVLGLKIEGGHGVKFTFSNINLKIPCEEFSFTIHHQNDTYTLLTCDPHIDDNKELNRTNALFKFVRIMRDKFQDCNAWIYVLLCNLSRHFHDISVGFPPFISFNRKKRITS